MVYVDQFLHTNACQQCLITGMRNDEALLSISPAGRKNAHYS